MTTFIELGLPASINSSLERLKITVPTPIQTATIPKAISGIDLLASAQTGSGKTIAYLLPLLLHVMNHPESGAIILTPTRELAAQVHQQVIKLTEGLIPMKTALLIGGAPMHNQIVSLKKKPRLIVGTPGRINDHLERGSFKLKDTRFLVIDEADRMLDMGFGIQLDRIAEYLPEKKQTLMFSATVFPSVEKLSQKYLKNPERISIESKPESQPKIKQEMVQTTVSEKFATLQKQLTEREGTIIVFVRTKRSAERISKELFKQGHSADSIHGDLPQRRRERVIHAFRSKKIRILIATDVAARGLDVPHVMHVINYDLPECPEDYIHRIGRTARAGAEGNALCIVTSEDGYKWKAISRLIDPEKKNPQITFDQTRPKKGGFKPKRKPFRKRSHNFRGNRSR